MTLPGLRAPDATGPAGSFTRRDGDDYYRISAYHLMPPFLMSLASDTDLWLFITSGGGLTAGRVDADGSLFPYETVDRLHDGHHHTGPITMFRVRRGGSPEILWQPFAGEGSSNPGIERNLYKNTIGNRLIFEEVRHDFGLAFRYRWSAGDEFGLVRTAWLENRGAEPVGISLLDGLRNVLPFGAPLALYQQASSLIDAYKRADCDPDTKLGIYSLTAKITDRAEAAEELRANTVWCHGLTTVSVHLTADAVAAFRKGGTAPPEPVLTGRRGNYLVECSLSLAPRADLKWHIVADVGRSHLQLAALRDRLQRGENLDGEIEADLDRAREQLLRIVGSADGLQLTGHDEAAAHHLASVLFNSMRGGVCAKGYTVPSADFTDFLRIRNRPAAERHVALLEALPAEIRGDDLLRRAEDTTDPDLERICLEYLPIFFGRRHGDPSRPWNRFAIRVRNEGGNRALHYEGNWRDIFQNWEALGLSFPALLPHFIAKFVNGSTVDGFNPYCITRNGIDWETIDARDPWSNIGYWGDHQIVYLLRLLEAHRRFFPGSLETLLRRSIYCYADVPYRLKPFEAILQDPHATIEYDADLAARIEDRVHSIGTDGKLLPGPDGSVHHVNLLEKLLVPALSKLSNLVPDGGIWMNTQRPEWNDANNALVGNGVSMVTLCHLRRYLLFLKGILAGGGGDAIPVSQEVASWFERIREILETSRPLLASDAFSDGDRFRLLRDLGKTFSTYRERVYGTGFSGTTALPLSAIISLCDASVKHLDHAIRGNRREDGLYHSYNLLRIDEGNETASLTHLDEMLEGQVAVLDSGALEPGDAVDLLDRLFTSRLYRPEQYSFLLYPEKELPGFLEKNVLPEARVRAVPLLRELLDDGETSILARDVSGVCRFSPELRNAGDLEAALDRLAESGRGSGRISRDRAAILSIFEEVFHHRAYTGRSGTMYGYEGLGCVYWHMVAKLVLAVQGMALEAACTRQPPAVRDALAHAYYRVRSGLGFEKTVSDFGAFPTDPYSHTPPHGGARQPGMTGQAKEEILARFGELGVRVEQGRVSFQPFLLRSHEFRREPGVYRYHDLEGRARSVEVPEGALAFSVCQVPVVYRRGEQKSWVRVTAADGEATIVHGPALDRESSRAIFERRGTVHQIEVGIPEAWLCSTGVG